jgi:hypothetical protein
MKALKQKQEVAASLPSQASSRLIGHDGPIQDVCFTGTFFVVRSYVVHLSLCMYVHRGTELSPNEDN